MDKTKSAIKEFVSNAGHKDTTVHETVNPAVQHETVKPTRHEEVNTAVDREIHQDHYHHTVQPVKDKEVLPEEHHHNVVPVEHREHDHRNAAGIKQALKTEAEKFRDEREVRDTHETQSHAPTVQGEHVHHHLHETVQPVIEKETIQPTVVHTTIPVHEVHHHDAKHHSTTTLPPVTMADFQRQGGPLGGREERFDHFKGEPHQIDAPLHRKRDSGYDEQPPKGALHGDIEPLSGISKHTPGGYHGTQGTTTTTNESYGTTHGNRGTGATTGVNEPYEMRGAHHEKGHQNGLGNSTTTHSSTTTGSHPTTHDGRTSVGSTGSTGKPSLLNKLNPRTDANGDGKRGFMK